MIPNFQQHNNLFNLIVNMYKITATCWNKWYSN